MILVDLSPLILDIVAAGCLIVGIVLWGGLHK